MIYFTVSSQHVVFKQWVCVYQVNHRLSENVAWTLGNKQQRFSTCCYCLDLMQGSESHGDSLYGELKKHEIHFVEPESKRGKMKNTMESVIGGAERTRAKEQTSVSL